MENKFSDIVERMVLIRKLLGMTRKELADVIGYSPSMVQKIESGARTLSIGYFKAFCLHLGVSADFMISGERNKSISQRLKE